MFVPWFITAVLWMFACSCQVLWADWSWNRSYQQTWTDKPLFDCSDMDLWDTTKQNNDHARKRFLMLLAHLQNRCSAASLKSINFLHNYGIGSSIVQGGLHFAIALRLGNVYRPSPELIWLWADKPESCTLGIASLDCYFQPISHCFLDARQSSGSLNNSDLPHLDDLELANDLQPMSDMCLLAKNFRKPLLWVYALLLEYIMRPQRDLHKYINEAKELVYHQLALPVLLDNMNEGPPVRVSTSDALVTSPMDRGSSGVGSSSSSRGDKDAPTGCCVIGVHMRGGSPDADRKLIPLEAVIQAIDAKARDLSQRANMTVDGSKRSDKSIVHTVYLCSDDLKSNAISMEHLSALYPRPWKYIILPRLVLGKAGEEQEEVLRAVDKREWFTDRRRLVYEYMADIELLAAATVFIGCHSNVYALVAALRLARRPESVPLRDTCLLDYRLRNEGFPLHCEGSQVTRSFWASEFVDLGFSAINDNITYWYE